MACLNVRDLTRVFCPIEQLSYLIKVKGRGRPCLEEKSLSVMSVSTVRHQVFSQIVEILIVFRASDCSEKFSGFSMDSKDY